MKIELVYATREWQQLLELELDEGVTARQAAMASGLDRQFPELDLATVPLGIFGETVADERVLQRGERVELYRKLTIDPMEARRLRAARGS